MKHWIEFVTSFWIAGVTIATTIALSLAVIAVQGNEESDITSYWPCYEDEFAWIEGQHIYCQPIDNVAPEVFEHTYSRVGR